LDTKAVVVLRDWPKFKTLPKELKLIKRLPKEQRVFMRTSPTCTYDPLYLIPSTWPINFWLIDANTPILSPLVTTNVSNLTPNIVRVESKPASTLETTYENIATTIALVIMIPYEAEALMGFVEFVSYNGLFSKANTLIDTATSLNFVSKDFVVTNGFYKDRKTVPKLSI
jgi:hypothetical protein